MKAGLSDELVKRLRAVPRDAKVYTEAIVVESEDVRMTATEAAAATLTNCTALGDGSIMLTAASTGLISYASGSDAISTLTATGAFHILSWVVDEAVPHGALIRSVQCYLTRRRVAANPMFDGDWLLRIYQAPYVDSSTAVVQLGPALDAIRVPAASMVTDSELVTFNLTGAANAATTPAPLPLDDRWRPPKLVGEGPRRVVFAVFAGGGSNTNYAWMSDSGASADVTTANVGTFQHRLATATTVTIGGIKQVVAVATATGMLRATVNINSYATNGAVTYSLDLGASPTELVEFAVRGAAPAGTSLSFEARATTTDSYTTVLDGQTITDVALVTSQTYQIRASLVAATSLDASPTVFEMGARSRATVDWTDEASWQDEAESVDPRTGQGRMAQAGLALARVGDRDYRGPEKLLSEQNFTDVEVRRYIGHPDLDRDQWLFCDLWRLDDYRLEEDRILLTCVGVTERLQGKYPSPGGSLTGYILKSTAASNLSASTGVDFTQELSQGTQATGTVSFTVSASLSSSAEESYGITPAGVPNLTWWPDGSFSVKVKTQAATTNVYCKVRVTRVSATGTVAEATGTAATNLWTEAQLLSAASTFVFTTTRYTWSAGAATDRLRVDYGFYITTGTAAATVVLETGTTGSEVQPPWLPGTQAVPEVYNAESVSSCWSDWVANVVAVAERYQGTGPANTSDALSKVVFNADGKRELERIAFCDGGTVIAKQGRICYANLYKARSPAVAAFTLEEYALVDADLGFRDRLPEFAVPYGFDGGKFVGQVVTQHAAALAAYGQSSIDHPEARVEDDTAKWVAGPKLAAEIGRNVVQAMGAGFTTLTIRPVVAYPELTIGDGVMVETDRLALLDVETGQSIRGPVWAYGVVIGRSGVWPDELTIWVRGNSNLFDVSQSANAREPYEAIIVQAVDVATMGQTAVADPSRAEYQFRVFPVDATVYYTYLDATATYPDPHTRLAEWTAYSTGATVQLARDTGNAKALYYFGRYQGLYGPVLSLSVPGRPPLPGIGEADGNVAYVQSGSSPSILVTAVVDPAGIGAARRVIGYSVAGAAAVAPINSTAFLLADRVVGATSDWNRFANATACSSGDVVSFQFASVDENGNVTENGAGAYTVVTSTATAAQSVTLTNITWSVTTTGTSSATRKWGFAWGVSTAVTDAAYDLQILGVVDGVAATLTTIASPATSTTSVTGVDSGYVIVSTDPSHKVAFAWGLLSGSTVVASGTILDSGGNVFDTFNGSSSA